MRLGTGIAYLSDKFAVCSVEARYHARRINAQCSGGLPAGTTEAEIEREFTKFGTLATVWVARKPPGFGKLFNTFIVNVTRSST